ncbi:MAG: metallophosphoesterase [Thalassobaculum sp.]|uniref:metallophosphoesterase family protein n=1 Tax=Thalassobaculum sp. TaxID=2022740 RepID=UPI0032EEC282
MSAFRIVHVSDTHLSPSHAYFAVNWSAFREAMSASPPDMLVHGGDLSFNGPAVEGDLAFAAAEMRRLDVPWAAIPGNHDIGEAPPFARLEQPINAARMQAWRRHVGPQWWQREIAGWHLIGLDTALMGSGLEEEREQRAFLEQSLAHRDGHPVMVFVHIPPFERTADEESPGTACIPKPVRGHFLEACATGGVQVIACGHRHVHRRLRHRGMDIVWAPTTAMVDVRSTLGPRRRAPRPGYLEWLLEDGRARYRLIEPQRMFVIDMTGWTQSNGGTTTTLPAWPGPADGMR